ncbi:MAPEG family protein [Lysobacter yangpyeongensis]|uniref:MAPEG family protein n=1 Tax=Lysobacter yangpyeongensis TaxID=346182 RepID=A0ABW0SK06_9GAMM
MALLTFVVWWRMYFLRIGEMKRERIHPQSVATSSQIASKLSDTRAADNFRNLFELPVLFYLALVVAHQAGLVSPVVVALAWIFVALRVAHSWIQCTYNKVMHRFYVYVTGGMVLWVLWAVLGYGLLPG